LEESFHRVILKYWKKGSIYKYEEYIVRRALAALGWNESREQSTYYYFKQNIADKFNQFLQQRSKSRFNVTKNIYVSQ
jgi:hypothetical protein